MLGSTLKRLGCCGVLVWLAIGGTFATFFIGEYLERSEEDKTFWKAGVQVPDPFVPYLLISEKYFWRFRGFTV